jgi:hypothetical protein
MPHPATRRLATRLPDRLQPAAQRYGLVAHLDANGQITQTLHGPSGGYREIVGVRQHDNWLYLGSLHERDRSRPGTHPRLSPPGTVSVTPPRAHSRRYAAVMG